MIVRIQQFEIIDAERFAGWADQGPAGAIRCAFMPGTNAFELSVLEADEQQQSVEIEDRRSHLRALISPLAEVLKGADESLVARLDGPLADGELLPAFRLLAHPENGARFCISPAAKLEADALPAVGSIRLEMTAGLLDNMCRDMTLGIDRGVRFRLFAIPTELVNPLLDTADMDDERWPDILPRAGFILQNTHGLDALQLLTRLSAKEVTARLGSASGGAA